MATLEIVGRRVEVDDSFRNLSPAQQAATVDEIARQMNISAKPSGITEFLGQAARSIGGAADAVVSGAINDVRRLTGGDIIPYGEGPVIAALERARIASTDDPSTITGKAGAGMGNAMVAFAPAVKAAQVARGVGGVTGGVADDAFRTMATKAGMAAETSAGALSGAGQRAAEEAGYPEWAQGLAGAAAPLSIPAATATLRGTGRALDKATDVLPAARLAKDATKRALVPMTDTGAFEVARTRVQDLAGGEERAARLGQRINPADEFGRTGAQQTEDPNLLGLQRAVESERPEVGERLLERHVESERSIVQAVRGMGGDVTDARAFFRQRLKRFELEMKRRTDRVLGKADAGIEDIQPKRSKTVNSSEVVRKLKSELDQALGEEARQWGGVPKSALVGTQTARGTAQRILAETPRAQQSDVPRIVSQLLADESGFGDTETVSEMHGLYSELRRIARSAMAGSDQNKNAARIANEVADAILKDLETLDPSSAVGRAVNEARAFSRALHETFDRGAVGRILKRTLDGDEAIAPESALDKTIGRGGAAALVDDRSIRHAAPKAGENITDFLRGRFSEAILNASGEFTPKAARTWLRNNAETIAKSPQLRGELVRALRDREAATAFAVRAAERAKLKGPITEFINGKPETAIKAILSADDPIAAARSIAATARKDPTGKALAGVKGAVSDYLTEDPKRLAAFLADDRMKAAFGRVFDEKEMGRLSRIAKASESLLVAPKDAGDIIAAPANQVVEILVRMLAAKAASRAHGGADPGVSLQAAQLGSSRANRWLQNLTNAKARQILVDAVEDPALMRALLVDANAPKIPEWARSKIAPYLTGALAADDRAREHD